jgi:hypothetical protein
MSFYLYIYIHISPYLVRYPKVIEDFHQSRRKSDTCVRFRALHDVKEQGPWDPRLFVVDGHRDKSVAIQGRPSVRRNVERTVNSLWARIVRWINK